MPDSWLQKLLSIRMCTLIGTADIVAWVAVGWHLGAYRRSWPVVAMRWWLDHLVGPLVKSRSWFRRTVTIATNNSLVCGVVVGLGATGQLVWVGLVIVGLELGVVLRMTAATTLDHTSGIPMSPGR